MGKPDKKSKSVPKGGIVVKTTDRKVKKGQYRRQMVQQKRREEEEDQEKEEFYKKREQEELEKQRRLDAEMKKKRQSEAEKKRLEQERERIRQEALKKTELEKKQKEEEEAKKREEAKKKEEEEKAKKKKQQEQEDLDAQKKKEEEERKKKEQEDLEAKKKKEEEDKKKKEAKGPKGISKGDDTLDDKKKRTVKLSAGKDEKVTLPKLDGAKEFQEKQEDIHRRIEELNDRMSGKGMDGRERAEAVYKRVEKKTQKGMEYEYVNDPPMFFGLRSYKRSIKKQFEENWDLEDAKRNIEFQKGLIGLEGRALDLYKKQKLKESENLAENRQEQLDSALKKAAELDPKKIRERGKKEMAQRGLDITKKQFTYEDYKKSFQYMRKTGMMKGNYDSVADVYDENSDLYELLKLQEEYNQELRTADVFREFENLKAEEDPALALSGTAEDLETRLQEMHRSKLKLKAPETPKTPSEKPKPIRDDSVIGRPKGMTLSLLDEEEGPKEDPKKIPVEEPKKAPTGTDKDDEGEKEPKIDPKKIEGEGEKEDKDEEALKQEKLREEEQARKQKEEEEARKKKAELEKTLQQDKDYAAVSGLFKQIENQLSGKESSVEVKWDDVTPLLQKMLVRADYFLLRVADTKDEALLLGIQNVKEAVGFGIKLDLWRRGLLTKLSDLSGETAFGFSKDYVFGKSDPLGKLQREEQKKKEEEEEPEIPIEDRMESFLAQTDTLDTEAFIFEDVEGNIVMDEDVIDYLQKNVGSRHFAEKEDLDSKEMATVNLAILNFENLLKRKEENLAHLSSSIAFLNKALSDYSNYSLFGTGAARRGQRNKFQNLMKLFKKVIGDSPEETAQKMLEFIKDQMEFRAKFFHPFFKDEMEAENAFFMADDAQRLTTLMGQNLNYILVLDFIVEKEGTDEQKEFYASFKGGRTLPPVQEPPKEEPPKEEPPKEEPPAPKTKEQLEEEKTAMIAKVNQFALDEGGIKIEDFYKEKDGQSVMDENVIDYLQKEVGTRHFAEKEGRDSQEMALMNLAILKMENVLKSEEMGLTSFASSMRFFKNALAGYSNYSITGPGAQRRSKRNKFQSMMKVFDSIYDDSDDGMAEKILTLLKNGNVIREEALNGFTGQDIDANGKLTSDDAAANKTYLMEGEFNYASLLRFLMKEKGTEEQQAFFNSFRGGRTVAEKVAPPQPKTKAELEAEAAEMPDKIKAFAKGSEAGIVFEANAFYRLDEKGKRVMSEAAIDFLQKNVGERHFTRKDGRDSSEMAMMNLAIYNMEELLKMPRMGVKHFAESLRFLKESLERYSNYSVKGVGAKRRSQRNQFLDMLSVFDSIYGDSPYAVEDNILDLLKNGNVIRMEALIAFTGGDEDAKSKLTAADRAARKEYLRNGEFDYAAILTYLMKEKGTEEQKKFFASFKAGRTLPSAPREIEMQEVDAMAERMKSFFDQEGDVNTDAFIHVDDKNKKSMDDDVVDYLQRNVGSRHFATREKRDDTQMAIMNLAIANFENALNRPDETLVHFCSSFKFLKNSLMAYTNNSMRDVEFERRNQRSRFLNMLKAFDAIYAEDVGEMADKIIAFINGDGLFKDLMLGAFTNSSENNVETLTKAEDAEKKGLLLDEKFNFKILMDRLMVANGNEHQMETYLTMVNTRPMIPEVKQEEKEEEEQPKQEQQEQEQEQEKEQQEEQPKKREFKKYKRAKKVLPAADRISELLSQRDGIDVSGLIKRNALGKMVMDDEAIDILQKEVGEKNFAHKKKRDSSEMAVLNLAILNLKKTLERDTDSIEHFKETMDLMDMALLEYQNRSLRGIGAARRKQRDNFYGMMQVLQKIHGRDVDNMAEKIDDFVQKDYNFRASGIIMLFNKDEALAKSYITSSKTERINILRKFPLKYKVLTDYLIKYEGAYNVQKFYAGFLRSNTLQ
ncbi:MAG: hypothetical protein K5853_03975 [Lachnospiraceae bacterium]|nr:hypothetical protein [Lachnospiraceae bacterium]